MASKKSLGAVTSAAAAAGIAVGAIVGGGGGSGVTDEQVLAAVVEAQEAKADAALASYAADVAADYNRMLEAELTRFIETPNPPVTMFTFVVDAAKLILYDPHPKDWPPCVHDAGENPPPCYPPGVDWSQFDD